MIKEENNETPNPQKIEEWQLLVRKTSSNISSGNQDTVWRPRL